MPVLTANGLDLYYETRGSGPGLVFVHGLWGGVGTWEPQVHALSRLATTVVFDSRGMGRSGAGRLPYTVEDLADDVARLLDHLELPSAVIAGLSMGGGVGQAFALAHPERTAGLVLISTSSAFPEHRRRQFLLDAEVAERGGMAALADRLAERWLSDEFRCDRPEQAAAVRAGVLAMDPAVFATRCRANAVRNFSARLGEVSCPVLCIAGSLDEESAAAAEDFRRCLPRCEVQIVPGAAHLVQQERPGEVSAAIAAFLRRAVESDPPQSGAGGDQGAPNVRGFAEARHTERAIHVQ